MKAPRILLSLLFSSLLLQAHALIPTDRKQRLTEHWEFIRQDMGSIWEVMRPITGAGKHPVLRKLCPSGNRSPFLTASMRKTPLTLM